MINQKVFPINTRATVNAVMVSLVQSGLSNNMQEVGVFMDRATTALSIATAQYQLARFSREKAATLSGVYNLISGTVYRDLSAAVPNMTVEQLETAKNAIYSVIARSFSGELAIEEGKWPLSRLVHTTQFDFTINATRQVELAPANGANAATFYEGQAA